MRNLEVKEDGQPSLLVSVGVPVRNGADFLDEALYLVRHQTHYNLEIIISDNMSSDGTLEIINRHAAQDRRIRVFRQQALLSSLENFKFVVEQARGQFFMWAAHDDRRSLDNVERLLTTLHCQPRAVLAFGDVAEISNHLNWHNGSLLYYPFESHSNECLVDRLWRYANFNCLHIYGLIRIEALNSYLWIDIDIGPDIPLLMHLSCLGDFVRAEGGSFYYYVPPVRKSIEERALANNFKYLKRFPEVRLAWVCAQSINSASNLASRPVRKWQAFTIVFISRWWGRVKPRVFESTPAWIIFIYRRIFRTKVSST